MTRARRPIGVHTLRTATSRPIARRRPGGDAAALFAGLALVLAAAPAAAQPAAKTLRFGLTASYAPFAERLPNGELVGADIAIARQVAARMGARAQFVQTTWQELIPDFAAGKFDIAIGGLTTTPERAAVGTFSIPLMTDGKRPLARCADARAFRTIAAIDRPGVRVQINLGPAIGALAKTWFRQATVVVEPDEAMLTRALLDKRVDVWVTDGVVVDHMARRYRGRLCATTPEPFTHLTKAWLIQSDPALVETVNRQLLHVIKTGAWRQAITAIK